MLSIDRALTLYTDQITLENDVDTEKFIRQLNPTDVKEFLKSAEAIRILYAFQRSKKFDDFFSKLDRYKNEVYNLPAAANFRGKSDREVEEQVDSIFKKEFVNE